MYLGDSRNLFHIGRLGMVFMDNTEDDNDADPPKLQSQDMSGGGCGAVHTSPRSGGRTRLLPTASPVGARVLTKKAAPHRPATLSGARALARQTAADHVERDAGERLERRSRPLVYRSSVRLLLLPVMATRRGQGGERQPMAIVRPAIRLPKEAEELGSLSAPATPAMGRGGEKAGRKVPKSVASMVRR